MTRTRTCLLVLATLLCVAPASAQFFEDLYRGLQLYSTPIGSPRNSGSRFGQLRIVPNRLGQGYRVELDRSFGADAFGRPEVYDLGPYELEISGNTQATLEYTSRWLLNGNANIRTNNLNYVLRAKSGAQDAELHGTLNANSQLEVNEFGFYTLSINIDNVNSQFVGDGPVVDGDLDANWDIGPINIKGNVFFDAAFAMLTSLGFDTRASEDVFPESPIGRINDAIAERLNLDTRVAGQWFAADGSESPLSNALAADAQAFVGEMLQSMGQAEFAGPDPDNGMVPEPGTIILLAMGGVIAARRRLR